MKLTLSRQLLLGYGSVLALLVVLAAVVFTQANSVRQRTSMSAEHIIPSLEASLSLQREVHHALSMHRGYMILGLDALAEERVKTWEHIDGYFADLGSHVEYWTDQQAKDAFNELQAVFDEFKIAQQEIADIAHTQADYPANELYFYTAVPKADIMMDNLQKVLEEERSLEASADRKLLVERVSAAKSHALLASAAISKFLVKGDDSRLERVNECVESCQASVDRLMTMTDLFTPTQRENFDAYFSARIDFLAAAKEAIALRSSPGYCVSEDICLNRVTPLSTRANELLDVVVAAMTVKKDESDDQIASATGVLRASVIGTTLFAIVLGIGIALALSRSLVGAIRKLVDRAELIAANDLSQPCMNLKRRDELGDLARSVDTMQESLRAVISQASESAQQVAAGVNEISAASDEIASSMETQSSQVQQVSSAVEEMSASISEVASKTTETSERARDAGSAAENGGRVVEQSIIAMNDIREAVGSSASSVQELGRRGEQIGEIISVINDIADQTNLLALNAAIEAARAGEHGRGFAVVADEVRKLADRTTKATDEIGQSITAIQNETEQAVNRMSAGTNQVEAGVQSVQETGESLNAIVDNSRTISEMVTSIAAAADEQSSASEAVSKSIISIADVTNETLESARQTSTSTAGLAAKAEGLRTLTAQFKF